MFKGTVKLEGEDSIFEFATIIGKPAKWREVLRFTDKDTMQFTIFGQKGRSVGPRRQTDVKTQVSLKSMHPSRLPKA